VAAALAVRGAQQEEADYEYGDQDRSVPHGCEVFPVVIGVLLVETQVLGDSKSQECLHDLDAIWPRTNSGSHRHTSAEPTFNRRLLCETRTLISCHRARIDACDSRCIDFAEQKLIAAESLGQIRLHQFETSL